MVTSHHSTLHLRVPCVIDHVLICHHLLQNLVLAREPEHDIARSTHHIANDLTHLFLSPTVRRAMWSSVKFKDIRIDSSGCTLTQAKAGPFVPHALQLPVRHIAAAV